MTRQFLPLMGLACAALLTACGGGGGGEPAPPVPAATDAIPDSASQSAVGLASYLTALSTAVGDDKEPLELSTFNPVQPEDSEPEPLS